MDSDNQRTELRRLLILAALALAVELLVMPTVIWKLLEVSGSWSPMSQITVLLVPRFVVMGILVFALGPFQNRAWFVGISAIYCILLLVRFRQSEVFVNWGDAIAVSRAVLPYLAGLLGLGLGFLLRRKQRHSGATEASSV